MVRITKKNEESIQGYEDFCNNNSDKWKELSEKLPSILNNCTEDNNIEIPSKIDLFNKLDVIIRDNIFVKSKYKLKDEVYLINGENHLVGIMNIKKYKENNSDKYVLVASSENMRFDNHQSTRYFFIFSEEIKERYYETKEKYYKVNIEVTCFNLEETDTHLCIDFGTSNTTAGCFLDSSYVSKISNIAELNKNVLLNQENIVYFEYIDPTSNELTYNRLAPTIVYVNNCENKDNITYDFGHIASGKIKNDGYCPKASCFMEIKRWTSNIDKTENIQDANGNKAEVCRKDIISQYLQFIIHTAENQFKCKFKKIHISAPVKLKGKVLDIYKNILEECGYELEINNAIDEGIAVLFSIINTQIKEKKYNNGESKKALIIDCGGGTSDLASCSYTISKDDDIIDLEITTEYMNGDVNFGGNNITFRIMQYLKIIYANYEKNSGKKISIEDIISYDPNTIFSYIEGEIDNDSEENIKKRYDLIYSRLEEMYGYAESIIPTRFAEYENKKPEDYKKVKNNFYFLWKLAEEMKKEFFRHSTIQRYRFNQNEKDTNDDDLHTNPIKDWKISSVNPRTGDLEPQNYPDMTLNKSDIATLLMADIYYLVRKFMNDMYQKQTLSDYKRTKLSGQSTKIDIFTTALKEFLPGKAIRRNISEKGNDSEFLKLLCVRGAIMYLYSLEKSNIQVKLENATNNIPISVYIEDSEGNANYMFKQGDDWKQPAGSRRITDQGKEIYLKFKNTDKDVSEPYKYNYSAIKYVEKSPDIIEKEAFGLIKQEELNSLPENKKRIFVYLNKERWGFNILPIYRSEDKKIMVGTKPEFCSFETDLLQDTFFDGRK